MCIRDRSLVSGIAFQGVPALLRDSGAPLDQVGLAYLAFLPWALKFLWAPWIERYRLPQGQMCIRDRVKSLQAGLADPKFQERMKQLGATVLTADANPQALEAKVKQQVPQWAELFKKAGVEQQ